MKLNSQTSWLALCSLRKGRLLQSMSRDYYLCASCSGKGTRIPLISGQRKTTKGDTPNPYQFPTLCQRVFSPERPVLSRRSHKRLSQRNATLVSHRQRQRVRGVWTVSIIVSLIFGEGRGGAGRWSEVKIQNRLDTKKDKSTPKARGFPHSLADLSCFLRQAPKGNDALFDPPGLYVGSGEPPE